MSTVSKPVNRKRKPKAKVVQQKQPAQAASEVDVWGVLSRRKSLIFASIPFSIVISLAYLLFVPPRFESHSKILLMRSDAATLATQSNSANELISQDLLATHMSLIQSSRIVAGALESNELTELPSLKAQVNGNSVVPYVVNNLYVTRGGSGSAKNSHTLTIAFRHSDPADCEKVVNAIVSEYQKFVSSQFQDVNKEAVNLIDKARTELEEEISKMAEEYQKFRMSSPLINSEGTGGNIHELHFQQLAAEIANIAMSIDETTGRLEIVKDGIDYHQKNGRPAIEKLTLIDEKNAVRLGVLVTVERGESRNASFMALQPERTAGAQTEYNLMLELRSKLKQAKRDYGANHPEVRDLELRLSEISGFLTERQAVLGVTDRNELTPDDVMNAYVSLLESDLLALKRRKADHEKQQIEAESESKKLISFELENQELQTKMSRHEALYDSVVTRLRNINMQSDATALIQEEIEKPVLGRKISPAPMIAAAIAMLSTLVLCGASIFVAEMTDKRVHSVKQLEEMYGSKVIGLLPDFQKDSRISEVMRETKKLKSPIAAEVITFHAAKDPVSESIRSIRTQLMFSMGDSKQILAVTSPNQGDGKTTVSSNLAVSLANAGKSVIVVDCDMRRPSVHTRFGLSTKVGLSELLEEKAEVADAIQTSAIDRLSFITAGHISENPSELLSSSRFRNLLELLRSKFEIIILDCPPVLPVSDPAIIAPLADGVLLVTYLDDQSGPKSQHCHRVLESINADLIGIVVNRASIKAEGYYESTAGYYGYQEQKY